MRRCGIDDRTIAAETRAMDSVAVGPTVDRSVHFIAPYYGGVGKAGIENRGAPGA